MGTVDYEKWIWIELIGFDNEKEDFGVAAFIENIGFVPHAISLLLYSPDFVHTHEDMNAERWLPMECCSYIARPNSRERPRQDWTNFQLRSLVQQLQSYHISVYCSFFDLYGYRADDGQYAYSQWCKQHRYLSEMMKNGDLLGGIHPLKRFRDRTYYEDFFIDKLCKVMQDYHFDGYHGADGYSSSRIALAEADYSDDMVEQFVSAGNQDVADHISLSCDGHRTELERRSEWVWRNRRKEWIQFYARRWEMFWEKVVSALHRDGRKVVFNTAWTRDPFEALYRYGIDYKRIAATGIDAFIVESVTSSLTLGAAGVEMDPHYDFMAMLMLIKAYVPDTKLICLNSIQDTTEQWDTLRHAPTVLERDIYALSNVYYVNEKGRWNRCCAGFVSCLSDGIRHHEWVWIRERWDLGFGTDPVQLLGACLVWSDHAFANQLDHYIETRSWPAHKLAHELMSRGAPIHSVINIRELERCRGAIVVPNPHLLPEEELRVILAYNNGPVIMIGGKMPSISATATIQFADTEHQHGLICSVLNRESLSKDDDTMDGSSLEANIDAALNSINDQDPGSWVHSLPFHKVSDSFLLKCAEVIAECAASPKIANGTDAIKVLAMELENNEYRLIIGNDHMNYSEARIDMGRDITAVVIRTNFPGMPIIPHKRGFQARVPGRGMIVVDITLQK